STSCPCARNTSTSFSCRAAAKLVSTGWANSARTRKRSSLGRARPRLEAGEEEVPSGGEIEVRVLPGDHLARIEQALGVGLALEGELDRVGLFHAPFLEGVAVGVEDHHPHRFVLGDDLVQPLFGGELDQRQPREPDPAVEADEFEMASDLLPIAVVELLDHVKRALARIAGLEGGDARSDP